MKSIKYVGIDEDEKLFIHNFKFKMRNWNKNYIELKNLIWIFLLFLLLFFIVSITYALWNNLSFYFYYSFAQWVLLIVFSFVNVSEDLKHFEKKGKFA